MELNENLDKQYKSDKASYQMLGKAQTTLKRMERQLTLAKREKQDAQIKLIRAQEDKNEEKIKEAQNEVAAAEKKEGAVKTNVEAIKAALQKSKDKVDSYIEELKKDPDFEVQINSILEKRYNRKLNKEENELNQLNVVIDLCDKHPTLGNNLKGMIHAQEKLVELQQKIEPLDPVNDKDELDKIQSEIDEAVKKKELNSNMFMDFCSKNNINVSKEFLDKLVEENGFAHDKEGNIKLEKSLNNIAKGYDKRIRTYQKAIEKIPEGKLSQKNIQTLGGNVVQKSNPILSPLSILKKNTSSAAKTTSLLPTEKLHWWQFKKRFDAWRQRRQAEKQATTVLGNKSPSGITTQPTQTASKKFRDAYKYDIVKDYVDAQEEKIFRETGKEVRKEGKGDPSQGR